MGEGIGVGFEAAMDEVGGEMQNAIPTDFKVEPDLKVKPHVEIDGSAGISSQNAGLDLSGASDSLGAVSEALKTAAQEIFALFMPPIREEFSALRNSLDEVTRVMQNFSATAAAPSVVINNTFNGVTASDVPHMVDRANNALLRRLAVG
jgi:hypothetical protein